jgi:hypothetical protein
MKGFHTPASGSGPCSVGLLLQDNNTADRFAGDFMDGNSRQQPVRWSYPSVRERVRQVTGAREQS